MSLIDTFFCRSCQWGDRKVTALGVRYIYEPPLLPAQWVMAVVNAREWMEEPLLKASNRSPSCSRGIKRPNGGAGFPRQTQRGWCASSREQGHQVTYCKTFWMAQKIWQSFFFFFLFYYLLYFGRPVMLFSCTIFFFLLFLEDQIFSTSIAQLHMQPPSRMGTTLF